MLNTNDILETIQMITDETSGRAHRDHGHLPAGLCGPGRPKSLRKDLPQDHRKSKGPCQNSRGHLGTYGMPIVKQAHLGNAHRHAAGQRAGRGPGVVCQNAGRCGQGRGRQLHRRLLGAGAQGLFRRGRAAHPQHPGGAGLYGLRLQQHQRRLHQERHQHGRRQDDGARHQGSRGAHAG